MIKKILLLFMFTFIIGFANEIKNQSLDTEVLKYRLEQLESKTNEIDAIKQEANSQYDINFYSILITVIVLILALKTTSDAKREARSVLSEETEELKDKYNKTIKAIKNQSNEVLNNFMSESDIDIILNDRNIIEKEYNEISNRENNTDFKDLMIIGLYYYNKNEYKDSENFFLKALKSTNISFEIAKCMIFIEKSISFQNLSDSALEHQTIYYDKIIELGKKEPNNKSLLKVVYQAYIYKIGRLMILNMYNDSLNLLNEFLYSYDLPLTYYSRAIYSELLIIKKIGVITEHEENNYLEELRRIKLFRDNKLKETILTRLETSFRYNQKVEVDIELIFNIFTNGFGYRDTYMNSIAYMFSILNHIQIGDPEEKIKEEFNTWIDKYYTIDSSFNFYAMNKWVDSIKDVKKKTIFREYINKFKKG